jgi:hypothetical protein
VEDVVALLACAKKYQVAPLCSRCAKFIENGLSAETIVAFLRSATLQHEEERSIMQFVRAHAREFLRSKFAQLPRELALLIVRDDELNCSETDLLRAIRKWIEAEAARSSLPLTPDLFVRLAEPFLLHVRFPTMSIDDVLQNASDLLREDELFDLCVALACLKRRGRRGAAMGVPSAAASAPPSRPRGAVEWSCSMCTLRNALPSLRCSACNWQLPIKNWTCPRCTLINAANAARCSACSLDLPVELLGDTVQLAAPDEDAASAAAPAAAAVDAEVPPDVMMAVLERYSSNPRRGMGAAGIKGNWRWTENAQSKPEILWVHSSNIVMEQDTFRCGDAGPTGVVVSKPLEAPCVRRLQLTCLSDSGLEGVEVGLVSARVAVSDHAPRSLSGAAVAVRIGEEHGAPASSPPWDVPWRGRREAAPIQQASVDLSLDPGGGLARVSVAFGDTQVQEQERLVGSMCIAVLLPATGAVVRIEEERSDLSLQRHVAEDGALPWPPATKSDGSSASAFKSRGFPMPPHAAAMRAHLDREGVLD